MSESGQSKSEQASQKRRNDAREEGQVVSSPDLTAGLMMFFLILLIMNISGPLGRQLGHMFQSDLTLGLTQKEWSLDKTVDTVRASLQFLVMSMAALFAAGVSIALLSGVVQSGVSISSKALEFKPSRLSPASGVKKIISWRGMVRTLMGMLKFVSVGGAMLAMAYSQRNELLWHSGDLGDYVYQAWSMGLWVALVGALTMVAVGGLDYAFQRWQHEEDLKMTKQEQKEENKEQEGSPEVKQRLRKLQQEAAKRRSLAEVPKASFVVTNPTHFAVAVRYDRGTMGAPLVVAKGKDHLAKQIRRKAREAGVPILERKPLARALYAAVDVGQEIPTSLYKAVAEILAHVYRIRRGAA